MVSSDGAFRRWGRGLRLPVVPLWLGACGAAAGGPADTETAATGAQGTATVGSLSASSSAGPASSGAGGTSGASAGSTGGEGTGGTGPCTCRPGDCPPACGPDLVPEVGFVEIEPVTYTLVRPGLATEFSASPARMWYAFQPAETDPEDAPLLVLFNGGPGAASEVIFGFNLAPQSLDPAHNGGGDLGPSPAPWTSFANLLAIDARITGYSYNRVAGAEDPGVRAAEFGSRNFNPFLDGADFVRAVLRFLKAHPSLADNRVVLVGESYGGTRASVMLDLLLDYTGHADGTLPYQDPALAAEIQAHFDAVAPAYAGQTVPPDVIAEQFSHQILVQPLVLGRRQLQVTGELHDAPGSVIFQVAADTGTVFVPCSQKGGPCDPFTNAVSFVEDTAGRDRFAWPRPYNWLFDQIDAIGPKLATRAVAEAFFGAPLADVDLLYAAARGDAYRSAGSIPAPAPWPYLAAGPSPRLLAPFGPLTAGGGAAPINGDFPETFGELAPYDTYYMPSNYVVLDAFYGGEALAFGIDPYNELHAENFLRNVAYVETFITNAAWDLVIWGPAIWQTMSEHAAEVPQVVYDPTEPAASPRPGIVRVTYADGAFGLSGPRTRTIRIPTYEAGHTASLDVPSELAADVAAWLGR